MVESNCCKGLSGELGCFLSCFCLLLELSLVLYTQGILPRPAQANLGECAWPWVGHLVSTLSGLPGASSVEHSIFILVPMHSSLGLLAK